MCFFTVSITGNEYIKGFITSSFYYIIYHIFKNNAKFMLLDVIISHPLMWWLFIILGVY